MALGQQLAGLLPIAGAGIGTMWGPAGTVLGGALGTYGQNLANDYFKQNSPAETARSQLLQQLQGAAPFQRVDFNPIANEEIRRFQQEVLPSIGNQFGGLGALNSSAYRQSLMGAGQDMQTRLAALRAQHELGQQSLMSGSEERRRQMLANLSGGMIGEENAMNMGRQQNIGNMLSAVPGLMLGNAGLQNQRQMGQLGQLLGGLSGQQGIRQMNYNQALGGTQPIMGRSFENVMRQDPTGGQMALQYLMQALGQAAQTGGQIGAAALMGGV